MTDPIPLTLESAVEIAMRNSYRIRQLEMGIERTRLLLKARRAQLKSSVSMELKAPTFEAVSDYRWNSTLKRDEIVHLNTRLWEMELSIAQPVILFGHPTNGYLSLNSKTYRYSQKENGERDVQYYNRYYVQFDQPLFQPNYLKNDIEEAELDLEEKDREFITDQVDLIDNVADDYYDLFELAYRNEVFGRQSAHLEAVLKAAEAVTEQDTSRSMEVVQVQVELGNMRERVLKNRSRYRLEMDRLKQRLGMRNGEKLNVSPSVSISPVSIDREKATQFALSLRPRLQLLHIDRRKKEIDLNNTRGRNSFRINLEMTYGMEKQDETFGELWNQYNNSYSVSMNAFVPIWDWGRRSALVEADRLSLRRSELAIRESENEIVMEIAGAVKTLQEYQERALRMKTNRDRAEQVAQISKAHYAQNRIALPDVLRSISILRETELSFLDTYLGYRKSLLSLMIDTYYDFEHDVTLFDRFGVHRVE